MRHIALFLIAFFLFSGVIYAEEELREGEGAGYTEDIGGDTYRYDESGEYEGHEQTVGDETKYYNDEGSPQGESASTEGEYGFVDEE